MPVVVTNVPRAEKAVVERLGTYGAAMIHEAQGKTGLLATFLRPIYRPVRISGSAVTCEVYPGDNWTMHVVAELLQDGDVLVISCRTPTQGGFIGDNIAYFMKKRGVRGVISEVGVRDIAQLTEMKFPVWTNSVCAQGTVKESIGNVNRPIVCGGKLIYPGDVIVADDDGVVVVPRAHATAVAEKAARQEAFEDELRGRFDAGELTLDILGLRTRLADKGVQYVDYKDDVEQGGQR